MRQLIATLTTFILLTLSCTVPKDARILKRATRDWRKSETVLWAYNDSPFGSTTLTLRDNHKFELTSSGFFMVWFKSGAWKYGQDTIKLSFVDKEMKEVKAQSVYIDRKKDRLYFRNADTTELDLRLLLNKINE